MRRRYPRAVGAGLPLDPWLTEALDGVFSACTSRYHARRRPVLARLHAEHDRPWSCPGAPRAIEGPDG